MLANVNEIEIVILLLGVIGTWAIAIIAIWGDSIRSCVLGSKLELKLHDPRGEITKVKDGTPIRYYHLDVNNKRKNAKAINVRVLVTKLLRPLADGSFANESLNSPLHLTWQFPEHRPKFLTIGHNQESCDLGCIPRNGKFGLCPYLLPAKYNIFLKAKEKIRIEIVAIAENATSNKVNLEISWDGKWDDDRETMKKHLVVKEMDNGG